ncbi:Serine carboxypeptidase S28 family protein [Perilla frutescens var. frutescens]|nr:Serine carboxypeptidase S28 family protein [Perilla frutescens var. frutescens]
MSMKPLRVVHVFQLYPLFLHLLLLLFLLLLQTHVIPTSSASISPHKIPRLSPYNKEALILREGDESLMSSSSEKLKDFKTYYYTQTLDHFNYAPQSYATFRQRYVVNSEHWGGPNTNAPIFAYLGAEAPLDGDLTVIGFLSDNAPHFKSLSVYIEVHQINFHFLYLIIIVHVQLLIIWNYIIGKSCHRYYGESAPLGKMEKAMKNETIRGYFNSAQAIADYAEILIHVKKKFSAKNSPIIVVGGSYGGMLASWFRLKYPHIALGALASSAPILYFDNITPQNGYYSIVTKDYKEVSQSCYETIRKSWAEIDRIAKEHGGLATLTKRFKTCSNLKYSWELKDFLDSMYSSAAQYNAPPGYPVTVVCKGIDGAPKGSDVIGRIFAGVVSYKGDRSCYNMSRRPTETSVGWRWQTCSEMVIPIGRGENDTMFEASPFDLNEFINNCNQLYGVSPRPHWVTTYYGGHDIRLVLKRFGSNIIFSNGLRDPYSIGGVLEDLSENMVAVTTLNGSHCLDILPAAETDPEWLVMQRKKEVKIIEGWLTTYYAHIHA